jgi:hypothetical protein
VLDDNLKDILQGSTARNEKGESPVSEDLGDCSARPVPRGCVGLLVMNGKEDTRAFQYQHLGYERFSADGTSFVIEFNIPEKWRMTVTGRSLWRIFLNLHNHKIEWIRKADRDFADDVQPIITGIVIELIKED